MRRPNARTPDQSTTTTTDMDPIKLQLRHNPSHHHHHRSTNLFSRNPTPTKSNLLFFTFLTLILTFFSYLFLFSTSSNSSSPRFWIVIDGGSTGTRIHVFQYRIRNGAPEFDFGKKGLDSMRVNPGLSSYAEDPEGARGSVGELVEFGRKKVPKDLWGNTEVRLMATAGLRLLEVGVKDRILESCRGVLRTSGFKFRDDWASVISGIILYMT